MAHPKIIVVGGGLAGLVGHHQDCRDGRSRRPLLHRPGQAVSLGVRAGRHQRRQEPEGRRRHPLAALRRHHLRRRLPGEPATGARRCATRRRASSICSIAWAFPSTARPRVCSTSAASAARSITAPHLPARPRASNCCMRSTSRCGATRPKARSPSTRRGSFSPPSSTTRASATASARSTCAACRCTPSRRKPSSWRPAASAPSSASRRTRWSAPDRRSRRCISKARSTPTASSSRYTPRRFPAKISCA